MNLIPTETLVFFLYLNKFANSSLNPEKVSLQNWKPIFPVISRILYNEWHGQTSLKFACVRFCLFFIKLKKLKNLY